MTILSPETVSIVLCQCPIMDMRVSPVPNQPKTAEILAQNALKMHIEVTNKQIFSRGRSPNPPSERGYPLSCSPYHRAFATGSDIRRTRDFKIRGDGPVGSHDNPQTRQ